MQEIKKLVADGAWPPPGTLIFRKPAHPFTRRKILMANLHNRKIRVALSAGILQNNVL
jgi:hypothetical protein